MRKTRGRLLLAGLFVLAVLAALPAAGAPLPENCDKDRGTVTCTTFEGPGNNQAGVGSTTEDETQGNTKNKSPEPQDLADDECVKQNPPKSQGGPIACPS